MITTALEKESRMKRIISVVGFLVLAALLGFGQQTGAFFRIVAPTNTKITAFSSQGYLIWTNAATDGATCTVQRAATLAGPGNWVDYVQHRVTNATMTVRVLDPNPPAGMVLIPAGTNSGDDQDYGAYSLTVEALYMDATEVMWEKWQEVRDWSADKGARLIRGGAWDDNAGNAQCGSRDWFEPGVAYSVHGFRTVCR